MKRIAFLLASACWLGATALAAQTLQIDKNNRTIAVTVTDNASALADIANLTVGFRIYAPDAASAYQQGSALSNAVMSALKKTGVPDNAIQSQQQQLAPTEFPDDDKTPPADRVQKQFTLSQSWTVRVAAKDAAEVLHVAIQAGANESGNIEWDLSTRDTLQAQAAQKALVRARAIAAQMAAGLDAHLGALIYASNQMPVQRLITMSSLASVGVAAPPPAPLAIAPQQVQESATVYAVFALE